jgi:uncharacterized protein YecE (DUF72 family)
MPSESVLESWAAQTPGGFRFVLKAPQTITHRKRLKDAEEQTHQFLRAAATLKDRRGPLLFQLPPNLKKDLLGSKLSWGLSRMRRRSSSDTRAGSTTTCSVAFAPILARCASPTPTIPQEPN